MGVRIPDSRGHPKAWESVSPTLGATQNLGKRIRKMKERTQNVGPKKNLVLHLGQVFAPNARSSLVWLIFRWKALRNKRGLYSASSC